jgi:penicillin-binding protein 1A
MPSVRRLLRWIATALGLALLIALLIGGGLVFWLGRDLPDVSKLDGLRLLANGNTGPMSLESLPIKSKTEHRDSPVRLDQIAPLTIKVIVSSEDRRFYSHPGFDLIGLGRAVLESASGNRQGGSTITAQLVRSTLIEPDPSLERKVREAILSVQLEQRFSKDEILAGYLNTVYWGGNIAGIHAASRAYFGIEPSELSLAQGTYLAALLPGPNSRLADLRMARTDMRSRLERLMDDGAINQAQLETAWRERLMPLGWYARYDTNGNLLEARKIR